MPWVLSRFRAGEMVEVRSREEILATLDEHGCIDGMPFMPEMLQYSGKQFRVAAVAHKSCDTERKTWTGRRLDATVHLAGMRCDGAARGGCQADCTIFWKDAWLKPVPSGEENAQSPAAPQAVSGAGCTEERLYQLTSSIPPGSTEPKYACQATMHYNASKPLQWWDIRQYLRDIRTGNHSVWHVVKILWLATLKNFFRQPRIGYRFFRAVRATLHRWATGREIPDVVGLIPKGTPTPTGRLNLKPGEYVRVKSKKDIEKTINEEGNNRGLSFGEEMTRYCGRVYQVRNVITQIIDEGTGKMIPMKQPCITLQGVVCNAEFSACRLMCPREIPSYWRELWLERVETGVATSPAASVEPVTAGSAT